MGATISVAALVLVIASAGGTPKPAPSLTVPQAATAATAALPDKDSVLDSVLQAIPWRRSPQAFAAWGGPWARSGSGPSLYDERYVTW
jgi:hypothetical protein